MPAIIGIISACIGFFLFYRAVNAKRHSRCVFSAPLNDHHTQSFERLDLQLKGICRYALYIALHGKETSIKSTDSEQLEQQLLYYLPFDLKMYNPDGDLMHHWKEAADCNRAYTTQIETENVSDQGGQLILEHGFEPFSSSDARISKIEAQLGTDDHYTTTMESAELRIYDGIQRNMPYLIFGSVFVLIGVLMLIINGLMVIGDSL